MGEEQISAFELKELLIELAMRRSEVPEPIQTMFADTFPQGIGSMFLFEPDHLDTVRAGASSYSGSDIFDGLGSQIHDAEREKYLKEVVDKHYRKSDPLMQAAAKMIDLEYEQVAPATGKDKPGLEPYEKASIIAAQRKTKAAQPIKATTHLTRKKCYDYRMDLFTIIGGRASSGLRAQSLYFNFDDSFDSFLDDLRDATQLSKIPPLGPNREHHECPKSDTLASSGFPGSQDTLGKSQRESPNAEATSQKETATSESASGLTASGYTLDHGAWMYRVSFKAKKIPGCEYEDLKSEDSYKAMIKKIQSINDKAHGEVAGVQIVHSLDHNAVQEHRKVLEIENLARANFTRALKDKGLDDEDIGEPFPEWLMRRRDAEDRVTREEAKHNRKASPEFCGKWDKDN